MTAAEFREVAVSLPEVVQAFHMRHPDFRVGGKIFATLGYPNERFGVVILTPDAQQEFTSRYPDVFSAVKGGWGRGGSTQVLLEAAERDIMEAAMKCAWQKIAPKRLLKPSEARSSYN